jgi:hypothetical protein
MAGVPGLSKTAQDSLKGSLASQSAPPNPQTPSNPKDRSDPNDEMLLDLNRIKRSCAVALEHMTQGNPEQGDPRELLIGAVHKCFERLLSKIELSDAVDVLLERLLPLSSQTLKQRLQAMYAPISPPTGLGGGAQPPGPPEANTGPAGGATGQPPGGGQPPMPGDAGSLPA